MTRAHPVRARRHAADRPALLRRLQLLADGDHRRLGQDVADQHAAGRRRQHPAVAGAEEGRHARRLHARQRAGAQAAARERVARSRRDLEPRRPTATCPTPAPARKCAPSRTATGSWSTTTPRRAATAWRCRSPTTRARRGSGRATSERDPAAPIAAAAGEYHYPSIIQARDGTLHATYSYFISPAAAKKDDQGRVIRKSIKHAHFNEAWIRGKYGS